MTDMESLKVLVVDDTLPNRRLLQVFLKNLGQQPLLAEDGLQALEIFRSESPDIVLMDVMMPGIDGFETARRIRALQGDRWVPIIFVTALDRQEQVLEGFRAGGDDYMTKPVSLDVLGAKLRAFGRTLALQRRLNESLRRTSAITANVIDGIVTADGQGIIRSCNPAAAMIFGHDDETGLVGINVAEIIPDGLQSADGPGKYSIGKDGERTGIGRGSIELVGVRRDGARFPLEFGVTRIDLEGEALFVGVLRDISERRRTEARLRENALRLQDYRDAQEMEHELAQELFDKIAHREGLADPRLRHHVDATQRFSGDVVAAECSPEGRLYVMLADATGHGLAAAISLLPALDVFYSMVARNLPLDLIVTEMNSKLQRVTPVGRFVAAALVCLDERQRTAEVWLGGMPEALWIDERGTIARRFPANRPALGIMESSPSYARTELFEWPGSGQFVLCSDGLLEAESVEGVPFGADRYTAALGCHAPHDRYDAVREAFRQHMGAAIASDDASLVVIDCIVSGQDRLAREEHRPD